MKIILILCACFTMQMLPLMNASAGEDQQSAAQAAADAVNADEDNFAELLFIGRCIMCHQLPEPGMLKPQQWKLVLGTMQQRMQQAGVTPLTEEETRVILEYLTARARN